MSPYANLAATLGVAQGTVKKLLCHMRRRYRWLLRDEVAHTVENPADVEDELRHLCRRQFGTKPDNDSHARAPRFWLPKNEFLRFK